MKHMQEPKKKPKKLTTVEQEFEHALEDFVAAILEYEEARYANTHVDTFKVYSERLKTHLKSSIHDFRSQFMRGYAHLIEEIANKQ